MDWQSNYSRVGKGCALGFHMRRNYRQASRVVDQKFGTHSPGFDAISEAKAGMYGEQGPLYPEVR